MSPTILRSKNLRFFIFPRDHFPPHVHVYGPDSEAKFDIQTFECFQSFGFSKRSIWKIQSFLQIHQQTLLEAWNENQSE